MYPYFPSKLYPEYIGIKGEMIINEEVIKTSSKIII